jgi:hypothetical protein
LKSARTISTFKADQKTQSSARKHSGALRRKAAAAGESTNVGRANDKMMQYNSCKVKLAIRPANKNLGVNL